MRKIKTFCSDCGCHFALDFEETLKPNCGLWKRHGLDGLPVEVKKQIWEWLFSLPIDEIAVKYGIAILTDFTGVPIEQCTTFDEAIDGYVDLNDEDRKIYQKAVFKQREVA